MSALGSKAVVSSGVLQLRLLAEAVEKLIGGVEIVDFLMPEKFGFEQNQ